MTASPRRLRVLYIAYPLLPVSDESCGGAEQILWTLEREMALRGHETVVAACDGSRVTGDLLPTGAPAACADQLERRDAEQTSRVIEALDDGTRLGDRFDLIHDQSGHFWRYAASIRTPMLATLHLPRASYFETLCAAQPPHLFFNCVSEAQARTFANLPNLLGVVRNGIVLDRFPLATQKDGYLLWMGRVCEEKGPHLAIEVARQAGMPLILAGQVYPFSYHEEYYRRAIRPKLDGARVRFIETPTFASKVELLARARAVLLPSLVEETSSLVAMEAMACGTPVIAFCRGGIAEVIADGRTGFLTDSLAEMLAAIGRVASIDPQNCRRHVEANFSAKRMAGGYEIMYREVIARSAGTLVTRAA